MGNCQKAFSVNTRAFAAISESSEFLSWARANGVYLITADLSRAVDANTAYNRFWDLFRDAGQSGSAYYPALAIANAWEPDKATGYAVARSGRDIGGVAYDGTAETLESGLRSFFTTRPSNTYVWIEFDGNGGTPYAQSRVGVAGKPVGELPGGYRPYHYFDGWFSSPVGGQEISESTVPTGDAVYYAHWTPYSYRVWFDANGGTVSPTYKQVSYGMTYGELPTPTYAGVGKEYVFAGWFTATNGGTRVTADTKVAITAGQTLYAHWDKAYNIRFHRNDASDGRAAERGFDYGESKRLPSLASLGWARRGFDFLGWATSEANASKGVVWKKDWASVSTAAAVGKTLDVWAVWKLQADSYAIRFIRNDGAGTWRTVGFKHGVKTRLPSLANGLGWGRRGYEFKGWALTTADANAGKVWKGDWAYVSEPVAKGKSLDVYAVWALKPGYYQVRFNKNDGTGKWRSLGFQRDASTRLSTIAALGWTRTGYSFAGWASSKANADAGKVWKPDGEWVKNAAAEGKTLSIYAIWRKAPETVPMPRLYESQVVAAPSAAAPAAFEPIFRTGELADGSGEYALSLDFLDADGVMSGHFVVGAEAATSAYACDAVWLGDNLLVETEDGDLALVSPDGTATLL